MTARGLVATAIAILVSVLCFARPATADDGQPAAIVLCYHIVEAPQDERMEVSRETFRQHLRYLEMTGYNVIPLRDLYEYVSGKRASIPKNAVVITIDDGWSSAYSEAWPELRERNFPFTLFIYPKIIGRTSIALTWEQIKEMSDAGVDIQSHSLSHPFLTRGRNPSLDDAAYDEWLRKELSESRRLIQKHTGKDVKYLAYPYGDYDTRVARTARKAGYDAALTCEYGKVRKGSDPHRMKRFVIDKRMDFAEFRRYMGAASMNLAEVTPTPGTVVDLEQRAITAKIPNFKTIDPTSVGMALLSLGSPLPYSYDARTGDISLVMSDALTSLKGKRHRAVVWAEELKTGRRVEASWTFELPDPDPPEEPVETATISAATGGAQK
ncbi:MAG TPA: polysaccharide deacetylase family protein [Thermoanaerobaculia bacterium]|nr:polysaccharide deacetylase family protein [Thermoanaerobaculia bacterium]